MTTFGRCFVITRTLLIWATITTTSTTTLVESFSLAGRTTTTKRWSLRLSSSFTKNNKINLPLSYSSLVVFSSSNVNTEFVAPTELPDSLEDAAEIAANACAEFAEQVGACGRCRIDFDTSAGDETYTLLKQSTEFMQNLVTKVSYRMIPGLLELKQSEMIRVAQARAELQAMLNNNKEENNNDNDNNNDNNKTEKEQRKAELIQILETNGRDPNFSSSWKGPIVRVYFPDEGSAALARRDWLGGNNPKVPVPCVELSACGGIQLHAIEKDAIVFFFCPKASESDYVETLLQKTETSSTDLKLTIFVNPNLVDMGVTGYGMAGRRLRERLLNGLTDTYYLRTLEWGALTRVWPKAYSIWQEDEAANGGYKLIKTLSYLPSNPEVMDIYDIANGSKNERKGGGPLDQLGDFVNGMMRL